MFNTKSTEKTVKSVTVIGKKGRYTIPVKFLKQHPVKQEKLYKEYWECII